MPFDPISWIIIAAVAGAATGAFWDEIKTWAKKALASILDAINTAAEVASDGLVYLVKEGKRVYKRVEVYVRNTVTNKTKLKVKEKEVSDVPEDIEAQLQRKQKIKVAQPA